MLILILSIVIFLFVSMLVLGITVGSSSGVYTAEESDDDRMQRAMSMIAIAPLYREDPEQWRKLAESITGKKFDK